MGTRVMNEYSYPEPAHNKSGGEDGGNNPAERVPPQPQSQSEQVQKFAGLSIGFGSIFAEHVLSHPCIVLRRQCQVHHTGKWYHLTPISLLQTVINIQRTQGGMVLWKGLGGVYVVKGIGMVTESVLGEVTAFPREVSRHSSLKKHGCHLFLKSLSFALTTPFYAASLVETVQSDIASERPGIVDVLFEGAARVGGWGLPKTSRLMPIWYLALPTVVFRLSHYVISSIAQFTVISAMQLEQQEIRAHSQDSEKAPSAYETHFPELLASFTGGLLADIITFPLETVLHRLYVQGTRTIIDNTDSGLGVIPINTKYEGFFDCFKSIFEEEGLQGYFRGFGALVFQYALHALILRLAKFMFEYLADEMRHKNAKHVVAPAKPSPSKQPQPRGVL